MGRNTGIPSGSNNRLRASTSYSSQTAAASPPPVGREGQTGARSLNLSRHDCHVSARASGSAVSKSYVMLTPNLSSLSNLFAGSALSLRLEGTGSSCDWGGECVPPSESPPSELAALGIVATKYTSSIYTTERGSINRPALTTWRHTSYTRLTCVGETSSLSLRPRGSSQSKTQAARAAAPSPARQRIRKACRSSKSLWRSPPEEPVPVHGEDWALASDSVSAVQGCTGRTTRLEAAEPLSLDDATHQSMQQATEEASDFACDTL
jgi:hypothetical protein